jgi:hypothetical protein
MVFQGTDEGSPDTLIRSLEDQVPQAQVPMHPRHIISPSQVEIMGLELFLQPDREIHDNSASSCEFDSYAHDSLYLLRCVRLNKKKEVRREGQAESEDCSMYSSYANDSMALQQTPLPLSSNQGSCTCSSPEDLDCDDESSSSYDEDIEDSLCNGYTARRNTHRASPPKRTIVRRFSVHAEGYPTKTSSSDDCCSGKDIVKRRSSIDNCNVIFAPDIIHSQHINNGGANAAA